MGMTILILKKIKQFCIPIYPKSQNKATEVYMVISSLILAFYSPFCLIVENANPIFLPGMISFPVGHCSAAVSK